MQFDGKSVKDVKKILETNSLKFLTLPNQNIDLKMIGKFLWCYNSLPHDVNFLGNWLTKGSFCWLPRDLIYAENGVSIERIIKTPYVRIKGVSLEGVFVIGKIRRAINPAYFKKEELFLSIMGNDFTDEVENESQASLFFSSLIMTNKYNDLTYLNGKTYLRLSFEEYLSAEDIKKNEFLLGTDAYPISLENLELFYIKNPNFNNLKFGIIINLANFLMIDREFKKLADSEFFIGDDDEEED